MHPTAQIHITRWGASGPLVLMIHGGPQGSSTGGNRHFAAQQQLAERGWRLVVPDRPGHGRSPAPPRPDDAILDGERAAELIGERAHFVGHSLGGAGAAIVAREIIPALLVTGGWNPAFEAIGAAAAQLMNGRHQVIKSPYHFPYLVSGEFNRVLDGFMRDAGRVAR